MHATLVQRLTIRHLRLIDAVAERRQLSLAAQALTLTQPAASRSLAEIEELCGVALFERHPRGMTPTPTGDLLARCARNVIDEIDGAAEQLERYRSGRGGTVRVGAVTGAAIGCVVPALRRLKQVAPQAEVHVQVAASRELVRDLTTLRLDFALARIPPETDPAPLETVRARGEEVAIVAGSGHPCAGRDSLGLADLLDYDWVMQDAGAPIRMAVEEALLAQRARLPGHVTNTSSLLVTIAMITGSHAVAPVSREVARLLTSAVGPGQVTELPVRESISVAPWSMLALRGRRLSPAAQIFGEILTDHLVAERAGDRTGRPPSAD